MALIECPDCQTSVSSEAYQCPRCGRPMARATAGAPSGAQYPPQSQGYGPPPAPTMNREALLAQFPPITQTLAPQFQAILTGGEEALYFCFLNSVSDPKNVRQWIMVTNNRVVYEASIAEARGDTTVYVQSSGSILLTQISYVGTSERTETSCGCSPTRIAVIAINSSGGSIKIAMPSEAEAKRLQQGLQTILQMR